MMDRRYLFAAFLLLVTVTAYILYSAPLSVPRCEGLPEPEVFRCYLDAALEYEDPELCEPISDPERRMFCFKGVAIDTCNPETCALIEDEKIRESCLSEVERLQDM